MLFNLKSPSSSKSETEAYKLKLQVYDRDILSGNDLICDYELDLKLLVDDCRITQRAMQLNKVYHKEYFADNYYK